MFAANLLDKLNTDWEDIANHVRPLIFDYESKPGAVNYVALLDGQ